MKHVEFYSKNKFEKLVLLVGFIIRIYHDARSPECQISLLTVSAERQINKKDQLINTASHSGGPESLAKFCQHF